MGVKVRTLRIDQGLKVKLQNELSRFTVLRSDHVMLCVNGQNFPIGFSGLPFRAVSDEVPDISLNDYSVRV